MKSINFNASPALQEEALIPVFGFLPLTSLSPVSQVCSAWFRIANGENSPFTQIERDHFANPNYDFNVLPYLITEKGLFGIKKRHEEVKETTTLLSKACQRPEFDVQIGSLPADSRILIDFVLNMERELYSLPFLSNTSQNLLSDSEQQLFLLKFFKTIALTAFNSSSIVKERDIESIRYFISELSKCSIHMLMTESDFKNLDIWIREITECQQLFRKFLPLVEPLQGESKGISFSIKKNKELRGWLFGTMHDFKTPEMYKTGNLCGVIYQRLFQCAVICTEIKLASQGSQGDSVENHLLNYAKANGIVNLGLDALDRDLELSGCNVKQLQRQSFWEDAFSNESTMHELISKEGGNEQLKAQLREALELKKSRDKKLDQLACAYQQGNSNLLEELLEKVYGETPLEDVSLSRQSALIKNTHACLLAFEKARSGNGEVSKGFFAYGAAHLICNKYYTLTLAQGLGELGWEVELEVL